MSGYGFHFDDGEKAIGRGVSHIDSAFGRVTPLLFPGIYLTFDGCKFSCMMTVDLPIKAALADWKKVVRGGFSLVLPFLVFEKSVVVAAMAAWAEAVQGQG